MTDPQVIVNLGTGGSDLNGQNGSTSSADSNDARFLDWPGDNAGNYVYLPGVNPNILTVPQDAAFDILGNVDLRAYVSCDDWSSSHTFINRGASNATTTYRLWLNSGFLSFRAGDGTSVHSAQASVAVSFDNDSAHWVRATRNVAGGEVKFYTSADGSSWSQLGTTQSISTNAPSSVSQQIEVGKYSSTLHTGKVYRAQVLDGIDGTTVLDVDTSVITSGSATSFTALTGQTVTINRSTSGRKSVAVVSPVWLFGTDDFMQVADNALLDFDASADFTVMMIVRQWNTPQATARLISKRSSGVRYRVYSDGTNLRVRSEISDSTNSVNRLTTTFSEGSVYTFGFVVDRSSETMFSWDSVGGASSSTSISSVGSLENSGNLAIGRQSDAAAAYQDFEFFGVAVFRRTLSVSELSSIGTYYGNKVA